MDADSANGGWDPINGVKDENDIVMELADPWNGPQLVSTGGELHFVGSVVTTGQVVLGEQNGWGPPVIGIAGTFTMTSPNHVFWVLGGSTFGVGDAANSSITAGGMHVDGGAEVAIGSVTAPQIGVYGAGTRLHVLGNTVMNDGFFELSDGAAFQTDGTFTMSSPNHVFWVLGGSTFGVGDAANSSITAGVVHVDGGAEVAIGSLTAPQIGVYGAGARLHVLGNLTTTDPNASIVVEGGISIGSADVPADGELLIGSDGELRATGFIMARVTNAGGHIAPRGSEPGSFVIFGDLTTLGTVEVDLGSTPSAGEFDRLAVQGTANLDGVLSVKTVAGFVPSPGDEYEILQYSVRSGEFAIVSNGTEYAGLSFTMSYDDGLGRAILGVSAMAGDVSLDGVVNRADVARLAANFGITSGASWSDGDLNGDGAVALADLMILQTHFSGAGAPSSTFAAVPEPADDILLLAVIAMFGLVKSKWNRRCTRCNSGSNPTSHRT